MIENRRNASIGETLIGNANLSFPIRLFREVVRDSDLATRRYEINICLHDAVIFGEELSLQHALQLRTADRLSLTDGLTTHVFELLKCIIPSDNKPIVDPNNQWLYFLRTVATCTYEELTRRLPDPIFDKATGVLEMIARNPKNASIATIDSKPSVTIGYEPSKRSWKDDWKGELIGKIKLLCQLLEQPYDGVRPQVP